MLISNYPAYKGSEEVYLNGLIDHCGCKTSDKAQPKIYTEETDERTIIKRDSVGRERHLMIANDCIHRFEIFLFPSDCTRLTNQSSALDLSLLENPDC